MSIHVETSPDTIAASACSTIIRDARPRSYRRQHNLQRYRHLQRHHHRNSLLSIIMPDNIALTRLQAARARISDLEAKLQVQHPAAELRARILTAVFPQAAAAAAGRDAEGRFAM